MIRNLFIGFLCLCFACKGRDNGFEELGEQQYFKLWKFGDCTDSIPKLNVRSIVIEIQSEKEIYRDTLIFRNLSAEALGTGNWVSKFLNLRSGDSASFLLRTNHIRNGIFDVFETNADSLRMDVLISEIISESEYMQNVQAQLSKGDLREQVMFLTEEIGMRELAQEYTMYKGAYFKIMREGTDSIAEGEMLCMHYTGTLLDDSVIDKSIPGGLCYARGQVGQAIPGLDMMATIGRDGDSLIIYLPPYLAFAERGVEGIVPPYSMLIYYLGIHKSVNSKL